MTPDLQAMIQLLRFKAAEGTLTRDEQRQAVEALRGNRLTAMTSSDTARRAKAKAAIPNADDLLAEMGDDE